MALYLVQHGISLPKDIDPDQGLSDEGVSEVKRIAGVAKTYHVPVSRIQHSGKKRAHHTAEIFASALTPGRAVEQRSGLNPLDDVVAVAGTLNSSDNLMLVGHLPFMERLTAYLVTKAVDSLVFKFQNGGILCLEANPDAASYFIKWALMPKIE